MHDNFFFTCYSISAVSLSERVEADPSRYSFVAVHAGEHKPEEQWVNGTGILDLQVLVISLS